MLREEGEGEEEEEGKGIFALGLSQIELSAILLSRSLSNSDYTLTETYRRDVVGKSSCSVLFQLGYDTGC